MLDRIIHRMKSQTPHDHTEVRKLADAFRSVRTIDECLEILQKQGLIDQSGLSDAAAEKVVKVCETLRSLGLGLEPNLLGRAAASAVLGRRQRAVLSAELATNDTDFRACVADADLARDRGDYGHAEFKYWSALQYFPSHTGFIIQYSHCLKEQQKLPDALTNYIDAFVQGALRQDCEPHALFVAHQLKMYDEVARLFKRMEVAGSPGSANRSSLDEALDKRDVITTFQLMLMRSPSIDEIVKCLCTHENRRSLIDALMDEKEFSLRHRDLLLLVSETEGGRK